MEPPHVHARVHNDGRVLFIPLQRCGSDGRGVNHMFANVKNNKKMHSAWYKENVYINDTQPDYLPIRIWHADY